jgi:acyl-coenzyme A synthetase/AMP-(fatty) acid ligase
LRPGAGVVPVVLDEKGNELAGPCEGYLAIKQAWPGALRTVYGDHDRFASNYFAPFPGYYFTGDGCRRDAEGHYWITGAGGAAAGCAARGLDAGAAAPPPLRARHPHANAPTP